MPGIGPGFDALLLIDVLSKPCFTALLPALLLASAALFLPLSPLLLAALAAGAFAAANCAARPWLCQWPQDPARHG